jgi:hypothetical protein
MGLEDTIKELRRATYIGKDFNTYVTELLQFLKIQFGPQAFSNFTEADLGIMLLELDAYANSTLSFYLDLQAGESYLDTAKLRNSVVRLCRNIGFKMTGAVPANTPILVSMATPKAFDVAIPIGTQLISTPGFVFETTSAIIFKKLRVLTGTSVLTKNSNIVKIIGGSPDTEITFGPNNEPISMIKMQSQDDTFYRKALAVNVAVTPAQVTIDAPFPSDAFVSEDVYLMNDGVGVVGNVPITKTVANPGFTVSGMAGGGVAAPARGSIHAITGNLIADAETFTISDGAIAKIFEFDTDGSTVLGNIPVPINTFMTAQEVAAAMIAAVNGAVGFVVTASISIESTILDPMVSGEVGPVTVNVHEGETVEEVFLSTGKPNQSFTFLAVPPGKMVAEGTVIVSVNNVPFEERVFLSYEEVDIFETQLSSTPPLIRFGDGLSGNIPQENADVKVRYLATSGILGNIPSGQITGFRYPVVMAFQSVQDMVVEQPISLSGGADFFSLSRAKAEAPYVFKSQDRAVTEEDYTALADTFVHPEAGAVGKAKAIIVRSIDDDTVLVNFLNQMVGIVDPQLITNIRNYWNAVVSGSCKVNVVQIGVVTIDADGRYRSPSANLLQKLTEYLDTKKEATVDIIAFDGTPTIIPVDLRVEIERETGYTQGAVSASVNDALVAFFLGKSFGDSVRIGDLYQVVEGVTGVKFSRISTTSPTNPGDLIPIPGYEPAYFEEGDLVVGKTQLVESRNIDIVFLD